MNIPKVVALFETALAAKITAAATSFTLKAATDKAGNSLNGLYGIVINEGEANEEFMIATIVSTAGTIVYRGISPIAPNTEVSALKFEHPRNASVKITNYPVLGILALILNGEATLPNKLSYASTPSITDALDIATKAYVDSIGASGATFNRQVITGTAGETIAAGEQVYFKTSDQRWWKTDADSAATSVGVLIGIAQDAGTAGNSFSVLLTGLDSNQSGLTPGTLYYLSNTAGALASSAGTNERAVGIAVSATTLLYDPNFTYILTAAQKAGLSSTTALASTNKVVSQKDFQIGAEIYAADSVGTDAYAVSPSPAWAAYVAGMRIFVKLGTANTGAATINVSALGAKTIKKNYNSDVETGDLVAGQIVELVYDGTNFQLVSPTASSPTKFKAGAVVFDSTGGARTSTISSLTFQPKLVLIHAYLTDDNGSRKGGSVGSSDGTNHESARISNQDEGDATISTTKAFDIAASGSPDATANGILDTFAADGFRINVQSQDSGAVLVIHWTALG